VADAEPSHRSGIARPSLLRDLQVPRYYFDIEDRDGRMTDNIGLDLPDIAAANAEAKATLAALARESIPRYDAVTLSIRIRSEGDSVLLVVQSSVTRQ
jgi:hypothetical protein